MRRCLDPAEEPKRPLLPDNNKLPPLLPLATGPTVIGEPGCAGATGLPPSPANRCMLAVRTGEGLAEAGAEMLIPRGDVPGVSCSG